MRPLIGITPDFRPAKPADAVRGAAYQLYASYTRAIHLAGGLGVALPLAEPELAAATLERLDGLLLTGGPDIPPAAYGETPREEVVEMAGERWASDRLWFETARGRNMPILGVCLGMQEMHVIAGGKMIQHIEGSADASTHTNDSGIQPHEVRIVPGCKLARFAPGERLTIASSHHQAVPAAAGPYRPTAFSDDGIIEAFEDPEADFVVGVQWHPERNSPQPDWIIRGFVEACVRFADRRGAIQP